MNGIPWLTVLWAVPMFGAALVILLPAAARHLAKYVALGISGALQHLSGIIGAETMIAVNTDRTCPMMARATLAVAGDVAAVLPLLLARLRERAVAGAAP